MPSYSSINKILKERLCDAVAKTLHGWQDRLVQGNYQDPATGWFYRGTVRALVAAQIQHAVATRTSGRWLVLTEQPYPESPPGNPTIVDVWVQGPEAEQTIALMINSDFDLDQARIAYQNLVEMSPRQFDYGYLVFCADRVKVADWQEEIETNVHDRVCARGIGRKTEAVTRRRRRRRH